MRKFLFSPAIWSSLFSGIGVVRQTTNGPRDWRLILTWVIFGATVALAVGAVIEKNREAEDY